MSVIWLKAQATSDISIQLKNNRLRWIVLAIQSYSAEAEAVESLRVLT